jgi:antitoxin (DNA-binding transcriptional repressor) of toxin-antitoxin stability system
MKIFVEVDEAAERFDELIELAVRGDEVLICRAGKPVVALSAIRTPAEMLDDVWALAVEERVNLPPSTTSDHSEFYDEHGLPK